MHRLSQFATRLCIPIVLCASLCSGQELISAGFENPDASRLDQAVSTDSETFPLDTLQNVSGNFAGTWKRIAGGKNSQFEGILGETGTLYFSLLDVRRVNASVHAIQGEIRLHDVSHEIEEEYIRYMLEGVYVEESQHVHAIAHTSNPEMGLPVESEDYVKQPLLYRQGLARIASQYLTLSERHRMGLIWPGQAYLAPISKQCDLILDLRPSLPFLKNSSTEESKQPKQKYIWMNGTAINEECGIQLEFGSKSTHLDAFIQKSFKYTLMMSTVTIIQTWLVTKQVTNSNTQTQLINTSMLMIGQQAVLDAFLFLLHLTIGLMLEPVFSAFASTAFFEFVLFALFEMRYMLSVWRARRSQNADMRSQQRELLSLYIRFYSALVVSIFLSYALQRFVKLVVLGALSFWIPQIIICIYNDMKPPLKGFYLWSMSATRLVLPIYLFGCPSNLPGLPYSPGFCIFAASWVFFQVLLLIGQIQFGPRFLVPKRFLPPKYDYFRSLTPQQIAESPRSAPKDIETGDGHECVICMNPLDLETNSARMITPCNHYFHPSCLQRWMLVKMECPTCRTALPPE